MLRPLVEEWSKLTVKVCAYGKQPMASVEESRLLLLSMTVTPRGIPGRCIGVPLLYNSTALWSSNG
jgi:hypothetical protein